MKVNIEIDKKHKEPSITIKTNEWTDELEQIVSLVKKEQPRRLFGIDEDQTVMLNPTEIDFICSENRKVYAVLNEKRIEVKMKLYEAEDILASFDFMRFSKSVVGNINRIQRFELSFYGNLCVYFLSGNKEYITRNYVAAIKEKLSIGGQSDGR